MHLNRRKFMVIQPCPTQPLVIQFKAQRFDQVQLKAGVGTESNDIAGIRWNLRLVKHYMQHIKIPARAGIIED